MSDRLSDWAWPVLDVIVSTAQVLTDELDELKRRRAQMRADGRELARQEKNMKKRRTRARVWKVFVLAHQAARQLSQDDLLLLLRPQGG